MYIREVLLGLVAACLAACTSTTQGQANPSSAPEQLAVRSGIVEPTPAPLDAEIPGTIALGEGQSRSCENPRENEVRLDIAAAQIENGRKYQTVKFRNGVIEWEVTHEGGSDIARAVLKGDLRPRAIIVNSQKTASLAGIEAGTLVLAGEEFGNEGQIYGATVCF